MPQSRSNAPIPSVNENNIDSAKHEQDLLRIRDRMSNIEQRYLNQDEKLDAILNRQTEYRRDMKDFHDKITKELTGLKDTVDTFNQFSWFIETINKWRNNLFWGVAKLVILAVCLFAFATNCGDMKSAIKKIIFGV